MVKTQTCPVTTRKCWMSKGSGLIYPSLQPNVPWRQCVLTCAVQNECHSRWWHHTLSYNRDGHRKPSVGYVLGRVPKVACILSCLSGCNFTVIPYCWYLIGTCDLVSSNMSTHFCWGEYLPHCGKTWSILSHLSGLIWSRNQRSTRESWSFLSTSVHMRSFRLRTVAMSSDVNLCLPLAAFVPSARVQGVSSGSSIVYYESIKRELKIRGIYECRCDERLQTKTKEFNRLVYTGLVLELEHLKYKEWYQAFFWVLIDLIIGFLGLIIKAFDNQTEIWAWLSNPLIIKLFEMLDDYHDYFVYKTFTHKSNNTD